MPRLIFKFRADDGTAEEMQEEFAESKLSEFFSDKISIKDFQKIFFNNFNCFEEVSVFFTQNSISFSDYPWPPGDKFDITYDKSQKSFKLGSFFLDKENQGRLGFSQFLYNLMVISDIGDCKKINNAGTEGNSFYVQSKLGFQAYDYEAVFNSVKSRFEECKEKLDLQPDIINSVSDFFESGIKSQKSLWLLSAGNSIFATKIDKEVADKIFPEISSSLPKDKDVTLGLLLCNGLKVKGYYDLDDDKVRLKMKAYFKSKQVKTMPELAI